MPYPNEHAARVTDPGQYDRMRRKNDEFGKGIHVIYGIQDGKTEVQAIRFDASKFTVAQARKWLKDHDYKPLEFVEATGDQEADMTIEASREELREARDARAKKYGIGVKAGGNLIPPQGYPTDEVSFSKHLTADYEYKDGNLVKKEKESVSLDEKSRQVRAAWRAQFIRPGSSVGQAELWPKEVFDDVVIIEAPDGLLSYPYTINDDGEVEFGEPERVEIAYQKISEFLDVTIAPRRREAETEFEGREWDVTIIGAKEAADLIEVDGRKFVRSKNGRLYDVKALKKSVPMWEGVKVYDNHLTDEEFRQKSGMRSVAKEWIGTITSPKWVGGLPRLDGVLKIVEEAVARKLKNAWDQGVLGTIGLSIDALTIQGQEAEIEGQRLPVMEGFQKILSVDLVAEPAAGGGFNRLIAANITQEVTVMNQEQLKALVTQLVTEALAESKIEETKKVAVIEAIVNAALAAKIAEAEDPKAALEPLIKAMIVVESQPAPVAAAPVAEPQSTPGAAPQPAPANAPQAIADAAVQEQVRKLECRLILRDKLDEAKLSEPMRRMIEGMFDGKVFEVADLDKSIQYAKEAQAAHDPSGRVTGVGGQRAVSMGLSPQDVAEIEFTRLLMGNTAFRSLEHAEASFVKERVTESYQSWIKAGRPNYGTRRISEWVCALLGGDPLVDQRALEAVTTSSMASIVKNAMNVMLANDYAMRHRWWEPLVRIEEVDTIDQATLVRVFGLSNLAVVNEGAPYTELIWADEEETPMFVKKGNFVGITLEAMLSDKVQAIRTLPTRLATSWFNTLSALVSGVFTVNTYTGPALTDTGALFNASAVSGAGGHANLLTAALSYANYGAARAAMMKQTDQPLGAGQKLLIKPKFCLVPVDLEGAANAIFGSEKIPGSANNDINPYFKECQVVPVPNWTDANDWALMGDPQEFPAIWLIFLRGRQVPELFTAGDEASGAMFTNDTLRYKVRMLTWRFSATYDCAPVSDFRALHKSNVT